MEKGEGRKKRMNEGSTCRKEKRGEGERGDERRKEGRRQVGNETQLGMYMYRWMDEESIGRREGCEKKGGRVGGRKGGGKCILMYMYSKFKRVPHCGHLCPG